MYNTITLMVNISLLLQRYEHNILSTNLKLQFRINLSCLSQIQVMENQK